LRQTDEQESFAPSNPTEQQIKAKLDQQEKTYGIQLLDDSLTKDVQDRIQRDQYLAVLKFRKGCKISCSGFVSFTVFGRPVCKEGCKEAPR
jgi:hypothetical protein